MRAQQRGHGLGCRGWGRGVLARLNSGSCAWALVQQDRETSGPCMATRACGVSTLLAPCAACTCTRGAASRQHQPTYQPPASRCIHEWTPAPSSSTHPAASCHAPCRPGRSWLTPSLAHSLTWLRPACHLRRRWGPGAPQLPPRPPPARHPLSHPTAPPERPAPPPPGHWPLLLPPRPPLLQSRRCTRFRHGRHRRLLLGGGSGQVNHLGVVCMPAAACAIGAALMGNGHLAAAACSREVQGVHRTLYVPPRPTFVGQRFPCSSALQRPPASLRAGSPPGPAGRRGRRSAACRLLLLLLLGPRCRQLRPRGPSEGRGGGAAGRQRRRGGGAGAAAGGRPAGQSGSGSGCAPWGQLVRTGAFA